MTTAIGIKVSGDKDKPVVLLADRQTTERKPNQYSGIWKKSETRKIVITPGGFYAFAFSGDSTPLQFFARIRDVERNMGYNPQYTTNEDKKYIGGLTFEVLRDLIKDNNLDTRVLVADREGNEPRLRLIEKRGEVKEINSYETTGSGSLLAEEVLQDDLLEKGHSQILRTDEKGDIVNFGRDIILTCDTKTALRTGINALRRANDDIFTSGLDFIVVQQEGIYDFGKVIDERLRQVREEEVAKILGHYDPKKTIEDVVSYEPPSPIS